MMSTFSYGHLFRSRSAARSSERGAARGKVNQWTFLLCGLTCILQKLVTTPTAKLKNVLSNTLLLSSEDKRGGLYSTLLLSSLDNTIDADMPSIIKIVLSGQKECTVE